MATIIYIVLFVSILLMPCAATDEVEPSLAEEEADVSRFGEPFGSGAPEASYGSCPAPITIEDRLGAIEAIIDVGQELLVNVTESLKQDVLIAQNLILRRVEEVKDDLTEKCKLDAYCKSNPETSIPKVYKDCQAWAEAGYNTSGVYPISPDGENVIDVYCAAFMCGYGAGWTVFQRRINGSVDFYRNWANYTQGFGDVAGEHWLGLDLIHSLTANGTMQLLVELEHGNQMACAHYSHFSVGGPCSNYTLSYSGYSSNPNIPGDSLLRHNGKPFSTYDRDHDTWSSGNCAQLSYGAWWYFDCLNSSLNGNYQHIKWMTWTYTSLKAARMMLKPR